MSLPGQEAGRARSTPGSDSYSIVLLRHGQSEWNARNLFTGWVNAALTAEGEREAVRAGQLLAEYGLLPRLTHTSVLSRAIRTSELALAQCDRDWIAVRRSWRLNSNHYGALQGRNKTEVRREVGEQQFMLWRRSYHTAPPPLAVTAEYSQFADARYAALPPEARPSAESLKDVTARMLPYWYDAIVPDLRTGACVLVVSHGNTLRALIKHLDGISDEKIAELNIPTGIPLAYELGSDLRPVVSGGRHLDPRSVGTASKSGAGVAGSPPGTTGAELRPNGPGRGTAVAAA